MIDSAWTTLRSLQIGAVVVLVWAIHRLAVAAFLLAVVLVVGISKAVVVAVLGLHRIFAKLAAAWSSGCATLGGSIRRLTRRVTSGRRPEGQ